MAKSDLTQITMVLDRSGSMDIVRDATIAGFNEFVKGQQSTPGEGRVTLIQFDTENAYEVMFEAKPLPDVPPLTIEKYVPRGGTPLHDCLGRAITDLGAKLGKIPEAERPGKVFVVVMTDGLENSSHEYTAPKIAEMIKHQREAYKWEFVFLGANQDAILTGEKLNIPAMSSLTYAHTTAGTSSAFRSSSAQISAVRSGLTANVSYSKQQREEAEKEN